MVIVGAIPAGFAREQDKKIAVVDASGTLGRTVVTGLGQDGTHEIIRIDRTQDKQQLNITDADNVAAPFDRLGHVEAIVSTAGSLLFGPLTKMTIADFNVDLQDRPLDQMRLILVGQHYLNDGGSITLAIGIVGQEPIAQGTHAVTVNAGMECFIRTVAYELPRGIRINMISPAVLTEPMEVYDPFFQGFESVSAAHGALIYQG